MQRAATLKIEKESLTGLGPELFIGNAKTIGIADIAVASLVAPLVMVPEYGEGKLYSHFERAMVQDKAFRKEVEYWRSTKTGQFAMRMYTEHRVQK